ncbi:MAG: hypothetical protein EBR79_03630 [Proteobacteria bacterium]|nr:hypothetical protein [Pseudomonadota bacterium]NBX85660.1 hypothetical protein [Pseudomonadota bacterium]
MRQALLPLLALTLLAGCSSAPKPKDYKAECPTNLTRQAFAARENLAKVQPGSTNIRQLTGLGSPIRQVQLVNPEGNYLQLYFFVTNVPTCPFLQPKGPAYTPVLADAQGTIIATGSQPLQEFYQKGWKIHQAQWPWQSYRYAYIPYK